MLLRILKIGALSLVFAALVGASAYLSLTFLIKGEDTVVVPDLAGKEVVQALELLTGLGLNTKIKGAEYHDQIPKDHVIFQDPPAGTEIKKGRDVRIVVSKGAALVASPNMQHLSLQQAQLVLSQNDLCQGVVSHAYDGSVKKDEIMAQYPSPGILLRRGGCVDLLVSLGSRPKPLKMPQLTGMDLNDAVLLVEESHLKVGEITSLSYEEKPKNAIVGQKPLAGYRVVEGSRVELVVNRGEKGRQAEPLPLGIGPGLFCYRLEDGFLKRHVQIRIDAFGTSTLFFDDYVKPGREICVLVPSHNHAVVSLFVDSRLIQTEVFD